MSLKIKSILDKKEIKRFNVRVYGLLIDDQNRLLLSDEERKGFRFVKFPGGGLEFGEGLIDGLKREFLEECDLEIEVLKHFYTTDFFMRSAFGDEQIISIYYLVKPKKVFDLKIASYPFDFEGQEGDEKQCFRMVDVAELATEDLTFPIDKHVLNLLKEEK